ncbi:MAG: Uma2 family endonuclease [Candidatus Tectomicrobia bacterium]|nr:Uma2 family endonuclease [Candidatus Tectomicrobia bacterium]
MTSVLTSSTSIHTLADLLEHLGGIAPDRVRFHPLPGTATEQDVLDIQAHEGRLCELVEWVLVEKVMGFRESCLAGALLAELRNFVRPRNLGLVTGEAGLMRLAPDLVRIPDVAFIAWNRLPARRMPTESIPDVAPDLVVEILSEINTPGEMQRKRRDYFASGVRLIWLVDPETRSVEVYTNADSSTPLQEGDILEGEPVLPGFTLSLRELFAELDLQGNG